MNFKKHYDLIGKVFTTLHGDAVAAQLKRATRLNCDAYFGGDYRFIFEFDEFQHFSTYRLLTLEHLPKNLRLGFCVDQWKSFCREHKVRADQYRNVKQTIDFPFSGGRTAQRAYFDCFRDLLPEIHGLNPTVRISEFEVTKISGNDAYGRKIIETLLQKKIS